MKSKYGVNLEDLIKNNGEIVLKTEAMINEEREKLIKTDSESNSCNNKSSDYYLKNKRGDDNNHKTKMINFKYVSSYFYILPIGYFLTAITSIFLLILLNCIKEGISNKTINRFPLHPIPAFYTISAIEPMIFYVGVLAIAVIGITNVWFYCSLLLQRFSVPELQSKKLYIHLMFIFGILGNFIYIFFAFSPDILKIEKVKIRDIRISLVTILYLTFIFFNILFAVISNKLLDYLNRHTEHLSFVEKGSHTNTNKKLRMKRCVVCIAIFVMLIYLLAIAIRNHEQIKANHLKAKTKSQRLKILELILFMLPYVLYILNSFINLSYFSDIIFIQDNLSTIIDREYFIENEELHLEIKN